MRRFLSLGAGVQSSTLYLMAVHGEFGLERPEAAIFADTQWEPAAVYDWLNELDRIGGATIPIHRVTAGNIREKAIASKHGSRFAALPVFTENRDGTRGMLRRQCTNEYKIAPVLQQIRKLHGLAKGHRFPKGTAVEQWMGISLDEVQRMKDSRHGNITLVYPLVDRRMTRRDCQAWLTGHGYPTPPKSACLGCPYTDDRRWREMKDTRPHEFADAVDFDHQIRTSLKGVTSPVYLHGSLKPLDEVDLSTHAERGQDDLFAGEFAEECEGMCGV